MFHSPTEAQNNLKNIKIWSEMNKIIDSAEYFPLKMTTPSRYVTETR